MYIVYPTRNWHAFVPRQSPFSLLRILVLHVCAVMGLLGISMDISAAQDDVDVGRDAFSQRVYPWYDETTDEIKRTEWGERLEAKSTRRSEIPLASPRTTTSRPTGSFNFGSAAGGLSIFVWLLFAVLIVGLGALMVWAFMRMESNMSLEDSKRPKRSMAESIKELPFQLETMTGDFRQLAEQAMAAGDFRKATIYLYSHVLVSLDQQGVVRLRKGKTNRQYLKELLPQSNLADYFQKVMIPFEAVFFGDHEPDPEEFARCWAQLDQFQAGVDQTQEVRHA